MGTFLTSYKGTFSKSRDTYNLQRYPAHHIPRKSVLKEDRRIPIHRGQGQRRLPSAFHASEREKAW